MDKCTICGADLESVCQEQSRQVLSDLPNESGGYDVEDTFIVLCGWCPTCRTARRWEHYQDGRESAQW